MLLKIEFYLYKKDIALYNDREFSSKELKKQLIEAEMAAYLREKDNFIKILGRYGWRETMPDKDAQYWYDRDTQRLFRYDEKWNKKRKGVIFIGYKEVRPCLNSRIKMMASSKRKKF